MCVWLWVCVNKKLCSIDLIFDLVVGKHDEEIRQLVDRQWPQAIVHVLAHIQQNYDDEVQNVDLLDFLQHNNDDSSNLELHTGGSPIYPSTPSQNGSEMTLSSRR